MTGDVTIRPDASCLVMTTEVYKYTIFMLYVNCYIHIKNNFFVIKHS